MRKSTGKCRGKEKKLVHEPYGKFKAFLAENNIKLREIADLLGCGVPCISMKNNGHAEYTMSEIDRICSHFNISSETFRSKKVS